MLFPCDDICESANVWLFVFFAKDEKGGFSLGAIECRQAQAAFQNLLLTAAEILRPGLTRAHVRNPFNGKSHYPHLHGALARFMVAFERSNLTTGACPIELAADGNLWIHNFMNPIQRRFAPLHLTLRELGQDPAVAASAEALFETAKKDTKGIETAWQRLPPQARVLLRQAAPL